MSDPTSTPAGAAPAGGNGRRPRRRLLVASILLNVFLVGVIAAGVAARHGGPFFDDGHGRPARPFEMPSPRKIRAVLPDSARPVAEEMFAAHRDEVRLKIRAMIEARRAVAQAMRAEPFDRAALDGALAELHGRESEVAATVQGIIADLATRLDADSRGRIATLLEVRRGPDEPR
jgi:uncharacterized membrane protein